MKKIVWTIFAIIGCFSMTIAQTKPASVAVSFPQNIVEYFAQPAAANTTVLPFVQAKSLNGDLFGITFQGVSGTAPFIELLDANNKVAMTMTVNDFLGKAAGKNIKLVSTTIAGSANRAENVYEIASAQGKYTMSVSSMSTSAVSTNETPAKLLVRIVLRNNPATISAARISLPFDGTAEVSSGGFIITGKKSTQPMLSTIFPKSGKITVEKKNISITVPVLKTANETLLLSLAIDCAATKGEAAAVLAAFDQSKENNISIVNISNKAAAEPRDTVTYQIICTNIGNGNVSDIVITNPISAGARYLEGSAVGDETQITFERTPAAAPAQGEVKTIKWKLSKSVNVGEEKIVSFKVIVQ